MRIDRDLGPIGTATLSLAAWLGGVTAQADALKTHQLPPPPSAAPGRDAADEVIKSLPPWETGSGPDLPTAADVGLRTVTPANPPGVDDPWLVAQSLRFTRPASGVGLAAGRTPPADPPAGRATGWFGKTRSIPEPASACLLIAGLIGIAARRWLLRRGARPAS